MKSELLAHYKITKMIGSGGMGEVYLAEDTKLKRQVALKVLPESLHQNPDRLQRFQTEAEAAARLNHPNIAVIHSVEEVDGQHFITMEYVEGKTLDALIPKAGLELERFFQWFIPLADALAHAHEKGIVHRDLKPGNIMVTEEGVPKILDFGLAHIDRRDAGQNEDAPTLHQTRDGQVLGTPAYMSPEQAEGKHVDHRSDIFSFGVVMYEALTGERPFKGESYASLVSSILKDEPLSLIETRPITPFLLGRLVRKCLHKDPRQRYYAINDVRNDLTEVKAEVDSGKVIGEVSAEALTGSSSNSRFLLIAIATLMLIAIGMGILSLTRSSPNGPQSIHRFVTGLPKDQIEHASFLGFDLSPDGKYLAYGIVNESKTQLYLRSLDQFDARPLPGTEGGVLPFFSPDSQWIGYSTENGLKKVSISGGEVSTICGSCIPGGGWRHAVWGPNDTIIFATVGSNAGLQKIPASGGEPVVLTTKESSMVHAHPQFLPDGKNILFQVDAKPAIFSLETGKWRYLQVLNESQKGGGFYYHESGYLLFKEENRLWAMPFDLGQLEVKGSPTLIFEGIDDNTSYRQFCIASDGTLVYQPAISRKARSLSWVDRNGQYSRFLETRDAYGWIKFSPDGKRIAVEVGDDIKVYEVESGRSIQLTREHKNSTPVWTPDGKRIAYASNRNGQFGIYWRASDLSDKEELLWQNSTHLSWLGSWHSNGQVLGIEVINLAVGKLDVMMLSIQDHQIKPFLNEPFSENEPSFSPDGQWVAYQSDETGRFEVYVRPYPGPGGKIPVSKGGGSLPRWSANGRELFYWGGVEDSTPLKIEKLYSVEVKTSPEFTVGPPRVIYEPDVNTYMYDVSPDGQRIMIVRPDKSIGSSELNIVLNWTEELRRLVPAGK